MPRFEKGNAGGPGRPRGPRLIPQLTSWCDKKGIDKLINLADGVGYRIGVVNGKVTEIGPSRELQFEALKLAFLYGKGKPTEYREIAGAGGGPIEVADKTGKKYQAALEKAMKKLNNKTLEQLAHGQAT